MPPYFRMLAAALALFIGSVLVHLGNYSAHAAEVECFQKSCQPISSGPCEKALAFGIQA